MNPLRKAVDDYLELRRALGFKLREYGVCLRQLVSFLESKGSSRITTKLAVEFATQCERQKPVSWARQLGIVRGFALYRTGADPTTEVPPLGLLPFRPQRAQPYLYTEEEIRRLLEAALNLVTPYKLQPWTYYCLFGLLAVSGMRLGEALNLQPHDMDWSESVLTIRGAKFGKSRLVPLHPSTREVLLAYAERRDQVYARRPVSYFFVSSHGTRLIASNVSKIFRDLSREIGIRDPDAGNGPRLHDFRHRFATETLLGWYRNGEQVSRRLPVLSTYLGHVNVTHTYWYLSNSTELMAAAAELLEARWKGVLP
jgi:integrase/recombinase XerD